MSQDLQIATDRPAISSDSGVINHRTLPSRMARVLAVCLFCLGLSPVVNGDGHDAAFSREKQAAITPSEAIEILKQGNDRFVSGKSTKWDYMAQVEQSASGQYPFASIVSCLDSRVAPEILFDRGIGDLFVARIAGNFVNADILGSLEFGSKLGGSKLIVVMGHTDCGAIKGACDAATVGLLTTTLANLNPAVVANKDNFSPSDSSNAKFVQAVANTNVQLTMRKIRQHSIVLREMIDSGEVGLIGAMYDLKTGKVTFQELADPP